MGSWTVPKPSRCRHCGRKIWLMPGGWRDAGDHNLRYCAEIRQHKIEHQPMPEGFR
jgi:hypothetical protein